MQFNCCRRWCVCRSLLPWPMPGASKSGEGTSTCGEAQLCRDSDFSRNRPGGTSALVQTSRPSDTRVLGSQEQQPVSAVDLLGGPARWTAQTAPLAQPFCPDWSAHSDLGPRRRVSGFVFLVCRRPGAKTRALRFSGRPWPVP
jgi:hypothetical protein